MNFRITKEILPSSRSISTDPVCVQHSEHSASVVRQKAFISDFAAWLRRDSRLLDARTQSQPIVVSRRPDLECN